MSETIVYSGLENVVAPTVMAIGGGKGGTGKSLLTVQLGILLAEQGFRVVMVDADPNGANLHTFFGLEEPSHTIDSLLEQDLPPRTVLLPTGIPRLGLLAGSQHELKDRSDPHLLYEVSLKLRFKEADIVLWDVGSGCSIWSTFLFEQADLGCWVVQPEPTGVEREYHFLRHVCRWRLASLLDEHEIPPSQWLPVPWLAVLTKNDPERAKKVKRQLRSRPFLLLGNQIHRAEERILPEEMMSACKRFFGIQGEALGWLPFDERVWLSVLQRRPIVLEFPESRWVKQLQTVTQQLLPLFNTASR